MLLLVCNAALFPWQQASDEGEWKSLKMNPQLAQDIECVRRMYGSDTVKYRCVDKVTHWSKERRGSVVVNTSAWHAAGRRFDSRTRRVSLLGVKTWLSTLEIVYLCVFRRKH